VLANSAKVEQIRGFHTRSIDYRECDKMGFDIKIEHGFTIKEIASFIQSGINCTGFENCICDLIAGFIGCSKITLSASTWRELNEISYRSATI